MARLLKANRPVLVVLGLALAAVAIVAGCGGRGGSSAASHRPTANAAGNWRALPNAPEAIAAGRTTVWTGSEMIVTGIKLDANGTFINSTEVAEAYNPGTDAWRLLPAPPKTENYCRRSAAWTGEEMLVWGCELTAYNPTSNQWRRLPDSPTRHGIVVWTGRELVGWGGGCCGDVSDDGSAYDPATSTWRKIASAPVNGQQSPLGAWTGRELVIFNGRSPEGARVGVRHTTRGRTRGGGSPPSRAPVPARLRCTTGMRSTCSARAEAAPSSPSIRRTTAGGSCPGRPSPAKVSSLPGRETA